MRSVLIANRGEIAVRIIRACRERGLRAVAVYSDADADAPHVQLADDAVHIGEPPAAASYLSVPRIIAAAQASRVDAIHPGYGFLSEQPALPEACTRAGLVFVGPPASAIHLMGSKVEARRLMEQAGVPCVPGVRVAAQDADAFRRAADALGYPVLVKASAGGGGKGMRRVERVEHLDEAVDAARREALSAFGDGTLLLERYLERARHIEVQVAADTHGACIHVGERECSLQRRHQKVVEEAPSPVVDAALRARMGAAAVAAAQSVEYVNVGTVEFMVTGGDNPDAFFFLEMNTRLQVEHPVTEAVFGLDLVQWQFDIADGRPLPWTQSDVRPRGHSVECRIYAEAPGMGFLPQAGPVLFYREPQGPGIRVDSGIREGSEISSYYDPLLAKLVVWADTRDGALARARAALREFIVLGVQTNIGYLQRVLDHPDIREARLDTAWLEAHTSELVSPPDQRRRDIAEAVAAELHRSPAMRAPERGDTGVDPWVSLGGWRG